MKIFRFHIKSGFIVKLILCACTVIFAYEIFSAISIGLMTLRCEPRYFPFSRGLRSRSETEHQRQRTKEIMRRARCMSRDLAGFEQYQFDAVSIWMPMGDLYDVSDVLAEQERGIYDDDSCHVRPGDVVLDAGAHVGIFAQHALQLGASLVIAIEPVPINIECLRRNLKGEIESGKVIVYPKGVWDKNDFLKMSINLKAAGGNSFIRMNQGDSSISLPLTTIDEIARELALAHVDFIKMDIEGSERRALKGAVETIRKYRPRMALCMYHLPDDPIVIPEIIRSIRIDYQQKCGVCSFNNGRTAPYTDRRVTPRVYFYF